MMSLRPWDYLQISLSVFRTRNRKKRNNVSDILYLWPELAKTRDLCSKNWSHMCSIFQYRFLKGDIIDQIYV